MAILFDTLWLLFTVCYPTEIDDLWCVLMISLLLYVNCHFPVFKLPLAIGLLTSKTWNFVQGIWDFWGVKENIRWTPSFWGSNLGRLWFSVTRIRMVFPMKADQFLGWTCGGGGNSPSSHLQRSKQKLCRGSLNQFHHRNGHPDSPLILVFTRVPFGFDTCSYPVAKGNSLQEEARKRVMRKDFGSSAAAWHWTVLNVWLMNDGWISIIVETIHFIRIILLPKKSVLGYV